MKTPLWMTLACALLACAEPPAPDLDPTVPLPLAPGRHTPATPDDALATWAGGALAAGDLAGDLAGYPEAPLREVLDARIDLEIAAAAAAREGWWSPEHLGTPWRRLLAAALVEDRFETRYDASLVPDADLERMWGIKNVRMVFDHFDSYEVADIQYQCCPYHYSQCAPEETRACIEAHRAMVEADWRSLIVGREHNQHSLRALVVDTLGPRDRAYTYGTYSFYYDPARPYNEQKGFHVFNQTIVETVAALEVGTCSAPVESRNGLHVLYLIKHDPAKHGRLTDPHVRDVLRAKVLPGYRERDFEMLVYNLRMSARAQRDDAALTRLILDVRR